MVKNQKKGIILLGILCILLLLWALLPINPYGYYILLRWICCPCFAFLAIREHEKGMFHWVWIFAVSAGIYNPIIPTHLGRTIWSVVNIISIILLIVYLLKKMKDQPDEI